VEDVRVAADVEQDVPNTWIHGGLHPRNVIVDHGRLAGISNWGDMCVEDPATDLGAAWLHFEADAMGHLWEGYGGVSEATKARVQGWAVAFGVLLLASSDDELHQATGRRALDWVCG